MHLPILGRADSIIQVGSDSLLLYSYLHVCNLLNTFNCHDTIASMFFLFQDEHLQRDFTIFEAAPQESRGVPCKKPQADYFL